MKVFLEQFDNYFNEVSNICKGLLGKEWLLVAHSKDNLISVIYLKSRIFHALLQHVICSESMIIGHRS